MCAQNNTFERVKEEETPRKLYERGQLISELERMVNKLPGWCVGGVGGRNYANRHNYLHVLAPESNDG